MIRQQRAKQFQPFDAMKGLTQALRDREERHLRVDRIEIAEDKMQEISNVLERIQPCMRIRIEYYKAFHYVVKRAVIQKTDKVLKFLELDGERIFFSDIYDVCILDYEK